MMGSGDNIAIYGYYASVTGLILRYCWEWRLQGGFWLSHSLRAQASAQAV